MSQSYVRRNLFLALLFASLTGSATPAATQSNRDCRPDQLIRHLNGQDIFEPSTGSALAIARLSSTTSCVYQTRVKSCFHSFAQRLQSYSAIHGRSDANVQSVTTALTLIIAFLDNIPWRYNITAGGYFSAPTIGNVEFDVSRLNIGLFLQLNQAGIIGANPSTTDIIEKIASFQSDMNGICAAGAGTDDTFVAFLQPIISSARTASQQRSDSVARQRQEQARDTERRAREDLVAQCNAARNERSQSRQRTAPGAVPLNMDAVSADPLIAERCRAIGIDIAGGQTAPTATQAPPAPTTSVAPNAERRRITPAGGSSAARADQQQTGASALEHFHTSTICSQALDQTKLDWESGTVYAPYIAEAGRRGLSVQGCRSALGLGNAVVAESTSPARSEREKAATTGTPPSTRASITSQSGAVVSFDSNVLSIDPQGNDVFNPRQRSYNISWTAPSYGNDVIVFVQISPNTRCIGAREYFQTVLQPRRRRVQELTEVADTGRTFFGVAAHGQGTRSGQDPFRNNEFTDLIFVSSGNRSTIVHIGARFPTQAASAIRREIGQIVSTMTFPPTDLYGGDVPGGGVAGGGH